MLFILSPPPRGGRKAAVTGKPEPDRDAIEEEQ